MAKIELVLPSMGEGITDATVIRFLKLVGEKVEEDESIFEVATDKVDTEIPAPVAGILTEIHIKEGDIVSVDQVIAIIESGQVGDVQKNKIEEIVPISTKPVSQELIEKKTRKEEALPVVSRQNVDGKFLSPLVRNIIEKEKITADELAQIEGTGLENRITKDDLFLFLEKRKSTVPVEAEIVRNENPAPNENEEIIEMDRMRKLIADHMIKSNQTSAHVSSFVEVEVTPLVLWRNRVKNDFLKKHEQKLTFTPIFIEATVKAIQDFPLINVSVRGDQIIRKKNVNIGMATALATGNLIVPVIKKAEAMNLVGLAQSVNTLAAQARNNKLKPTDIQGGTFTITNLGTFGNLTGTPIINQPEVAILATGVIKKKPAVIETPEGDMIAIRHLMILSLSYDHRVVDGALGGAFLKRIADYLEGFDVSQKI